MKFLVSLFPQILTQQVPWILSGRVHDNILFGKIYDPERYNAFNLRSFLCLNFNLLEWNFLCLCFLKFSHNRSRGFYLERCVTTYYLGKVMILKGDGDAIPFFFLSNFLLFAYQTIGTRKLKKNLVPFLLFLLGSVNVDGYLLALSLGLTSIIK